MTYDDSVSLSVSEKGGLRTGGEDRYPDIVERQSVIDYWRRADADKSEEKARDAGTSEVGASGASEVKESGASQSEEGE